VAAAILLLAPSPPLLFMGEEFGAETPFLFFCDFDGDLAAAVTAGRRGEFADFSAFNDPAALERIPDPNAIATFETSRLNWNVIAQKRHRQWLDLYHKLLRLRREHIVPLLATACKLKGDYEIHGDHGLTVRWVFPDHAELTLAANLGKESLSVSEMPDTPIIYSSPEVNIDELRRGTLPGWSAVWFLKS
jgi:1,4-alpha-glucan branching enzyme